MRPVLSAFVLTRLGLLLARLAAPLIFARPAGLSQIGPPLLAMWVRWDGPIYMTLAQVGYHERERVPATAFFPLCSFLMLLMSNHLASMPRYALTVFPVFFVLAQLGSDRRFHWLLVAVSFALALVAMARFTQWRWIA